MYAIFTDTEIMTLPSENPKISPARPWLLSPRSRSVVAVFCLLILATIAAPYAYAAALHRGHITVDMLVEGSLSMLVHAVPITPYFLLLLFLRQGHRLRTRLAWPLALLAIWASIATYFSYFFDLLQFHPSLRQFPQLFQASTIAILLVPPLGVLVGQTLLGTALAGLRTWAHHWFLSPAQRGAVLLCYLATVAAITPPLLVQLRFPANWMPGFPSIEWLALGMLHAPFFVYISLLPRRTSFGARLSWPVGALSIALSALLFGLEILSMHPFRLPIPLREFPAVYGISTQLFALGPPIFILIAQVVVLHAQVRLHPSARQLAQKEERQHPWAYMASLAAFRRWGLFALYAGAMLALHRRILESVLHIP